MFTTISKGTFRAFCEITCWLNLIFCAYSGIAIGNSMAQPAQQATFFSAGSAGTAGHPFLGFIIGSIIGLISNMVFGGFVAAFLEVCEDIKRNRENTANLKQNWENIPNRGTTAKVNVLSNNLSANNSNTAQRSSNKPTNLGLDLESIGDEITQFDITLHSAGAEKMKVVNIIQAITGLNLMDAKNIASYAPKLLKANCSKDEAKLIKKKIEDAGGTISVSASN